MRVSRLMFASSSILVAAVIFATVGCGNGGPPAKALTAGSRRLKCEKDIKVDPSKKHGVDKENIYICEDEPTVKWTAAPGVTFSLDFGGNCPFVSCQISDSQPTGTVNYPSTTQPLAVFKYKITINGNSPPDYDPRVVGGGGF